MKRELLLIGLFLIIGVAGAGCAASDSQSKSAETINANATLTRTPVAAATASSPASTPGGGAAAESATPDHSAMGADNNQVPAFEVNEASLKNLPPTLPPDMFTGQPRQAYQAAREIPKTLAQLPCYCHCDKGFGHKSLHSCYADNHASMCAVCVDEALMAYRLEKQEHLKPAQIRERIIAKYAAEF